MTNSSAAEVRIGTSGWHYKHWLGSFYPAKLPSSRMLEHYVHRFDSVELNNTFYRLPPESAVDTWRDSTPVGFVFAVKGSRFLTHMKKLRDPEIALGRFFERAGRLGEKCGPVLWQLPPHWGLDLDRLRTFLAALPAGYRHGFEFRDPAWHVPEVYNLLREYNAAFCAFDLAGFESPVEITADWTYVRLHGPGGKYQGSYNSEELAGWASRIEQWRSRLKAVYVYFDNDQAGYAPANASELSRLVAAG